MPRFILAFAHDLRQPLYQHFLAILLDVIHGLAHLLPLLPFGLATPHFNRSLASPQDALRYVVNGRAALDRIIERYQIKKDPASLIANDPNAWGLNEPDYIIKHLRRVTYVSVEITKVIDALADQNLFWKRQFQ